MSTPVKISDIERLLEDVTYLEDEATALQYLISDLPFAERPPEGESIFDLLLRIDRLQTECYRPAVKSVLEHHKDVSVPDLVAGESPESPPSVADIQQLLRDIAKHRASLLALAQRLTQTQWETPCRTAGVKTGTLFEALKLMVQKERGMLRQIALLVRDAQLHREQMRQQRPGSTPPH